MDSSAKVCILSDRVRVSAAAERTTLWGWDIQFLEEKLRKSGIPLDLVCYDSVSRKILGPSAADEAACLARLNAHPNLRVIVPLEEVGLRLTTGQKSLGKWHLSPLDCLPTLKCRKAVPTWHPDAVKKDFALGLYVERAFIRIREELGTIEYSRKPKRFLLNPTLEETHATLDRLAALGPEDWLACDIETGRGQINTVGFAWSESDAIAIGVLPERCGAAEFHRLWSRIGAVLSGKSRKVFQNGIYEVLYFARYGLRVENFAFDTMNAQKFLWPEFEKGLANVGRFYTREPYWKDSGRVESEEGKQKDWGAVRDWPRHYTYNCMDSAGTYEAMLGQRADLAARGQLNFFDSYLMRLHGYMREMCLRGFPLDEGVRKKLIEEAEAKSAELTKQLSRELNPRSSKQKLALFREKGYSLPKVRGKDGFRESADETSLKKLRLKYPEDRDISLLLDIAEHDSSLSKYLRVKTDPYDQQVRFMMDICGTETGRWSSGMDAWDRGLNAQTLPKYAKKMLVHKSCIFMQIDLKQAESRFVAYDSADPDLIAALEDPTRDIHSEVAAEIFECPVAQVRAEHKAGDSGKRQLGKKSGHGANYNMGAATFQDSCLKELDLVVTKEFASRVLEAYHKLFPGIRRWHASLRDEVYNTRKLGNPFGRVRYFYGRMDDNTFREAYAYRPQSSVPDIVNHLLLGLGAQRDAGKLAFDVHLQCHDSITLACAPEWADAIAEFAYDLDRWHPEVRLRAGLLRIPVSIEVGNCLGALRDYERGAL